MSDLLRPAGIVDNFLVSTTEKVVLSTLAKSLNVDAIVTATTTVDLNANGVLASLVGQGQHKPSGKTLIMVKDAHWRSIPKGRASFN